MCKKFFQTHLYLSCTHAPTLIIADIIEEYLKRIWRIIVKPNRKNKFQSKSTKILFRYQAISGSVRSCVLSRSELVFHQIYRPPSQATSFPYWWVSYNGATFFFSEDLEISLSVNCLLGVRQWLMIHLEFLWLLLRPSDFRLRPRKKYGLFPVTVWKK